MITGDFHTHGSFSHGKGSAMENAKEAVKKGLKSLAITEHGLFIIAGGLHAKEIKEARQEFDEAQKAFPQLKMYFGVEADLISPEGEIDLPKEFENVFDVVLVGMHYFVKGTKQRNVIKIVWRNLFRKFIRDREKLKEINTRALVNAMHRYRIDALSHLGTSMPDFDLERIAKAAEDTDTCIELNNKHCSLSLEQLVFLAKTNVKFLLSSDAHHPEKVGQVEQMLALALEAGIDEKNILNLNQEYIPKRLREGMA
ncbi:MAG: PHP domain-containing protein [Clostridia bacterium]|nr:PHP domain-containing protein [Clostridia bacterium]